MLKKVRPGIVLDVRVMQHFMLGETRITLRGKEAQLCYFHVQTKEEGADGATKIKSWSAQANLGEYVCVGKSRIRVEKKHGQVARLRVVAEKGIVVKRQNSLTRETI